MSQNHDQKPLLVLQGISKSFPGVKALNKVNATVHKGEIHALCGENGAGKSTLMKIIAGNLTADEGTIHFDGQVEKFRNPREANEKGIVLVHQELSLVPYISVAENIFMGNLPRKGFYAIDWKSLYKKARTVLDELELPIDERELVGHLTIAKQQMVEIARALYGNVKLVIFDEPTASLTHHEKDILFRNIRKLKEKGTAILYISHKMDEIFSITDRITILRDGNVTGTVITGETNEEEITNYMIGRKIHSFIEKSEKTLGQDVLHVDQLSSHGQFTDITFGVKEKEIVGLYGLVGAGRTEIAETIFGVRKATRGDVYIHGVKQHIRKPKDAIKQGIGLVPESRKEQGLFLEAGGSFNLSMPTLHRMHRAGFTRKTLELQLYQEYKEKLNIKTPGPLQSVVHLSGGNQQKFVIGKWLSANPKLLILDEPTRGIDVGAKAEIHKLIAGLAESGMAILVISSEMPEIISLCDRVLTIKSGKVTGEFTGSDITEKNLIQAI